MDSAHSITGLENVSMFRYAGMAVAMRNADQAAARAAHAVCGDPESSGAAEILRRYVLIGA
ncbi:MAG: HAD hydrolase family protein [Firmicutes bacterium]|nr:HAD hydrolase family protein [Bacillota bacterium]